MFQSLELLPDDPLLGLLSAYRADPSSEKVDLGVGVYKDERGRTPVLEAVRAAERWLITEQETKAYIGPAGNERFNDAIAKLVLGAEHLALRAKRVRVVQAPGGCGALRLAAELITQANAGATIHIGDPTWANHVPLLKSAGLKLRYYPYYNALTGEVRFDQIVRALGVLPRGDVILLHGSCHNPTGADISSDQWHALADVVSERGLIPFVDLAYQGLGEGLDQDAQGVRVLASAVPEMLIAASCSKNFGLYRERVGAFLVVAENELHANTVASNVCRVARGLYSMPPDHGAAVVVRIVEDAKLAALWRTELKRMRERTLLLRNALSEALAYACRSRNLSYVSTQHGMFSLMDLPPGAVDRLRRDKHIYLANDGRINISGLNEYSVDYVAWSIAAELDRQA